MIKINTHKIEHQPKNKYLFETIIPKNQQYTQLIQY
jgi:hypothetical protein